MWWVEEEKYVIKRKWTEDWLNNIALGYFFEDCPTWESGPVHGCFAPVQDAITHSKDYDEWAEEFSHAYLIYSDKDYIIQDLLNHPRPKYKHLIEYRIKLLLRDSVFLEPGARRSFSTRCMENFWEPYDCGNLTKHIILHENTQLTLYAPGFFWHHLYLRLENKTSEEIYIPSGEEIGFLIII